MLFRNFIWWIALLTSLTSCQPNASEHLIIDAPPIEDSRYWQTQIDFLTKLIRQKPNETIYYYLRAKCFMPLSRWKEALADIRFAVEQAPQQPEYWLLYAQLAKKAGEKDEIWLEALLKAEKLGCHLPALWQMLGEYYFQHNNLALAEEYLQKTTLLISDQSNIYFYLGKIYQQRGDTTKAFQYYREALKLDKHVLPYYISLMQLHSQFGQYREVITLAEEALRHNLKDASLCYLLGYALENTSRNKPDTAAYWYHYSLALDSTFWKANEQLAYLELGKKNYSNVIRYLEKTIRLQPNYIEPYLRLARLYEQKIMNFWMAQKYYLAAYHLDSLNQEAIRGKSRIEWKLKKGVSQ